jgi:predicted amidophosphoribosyltransferase
LRRIVPPLCERCGCPTAWPLQRCAECAGRRLAFLRARAAVEYDGPVRRVVASWKERGLRRLAGWAATVMADAVPRPEVSVLAHVPGDPGRRLERGHHAAERLARELAGAWDLPFEHLLQRDAGSRRQRGLSRPERRRNVAGAFSTAGAVPAQVCLVDDVYTTGATVNAAASTLRKAGTKRVEVVTFARAIRVR